MEDHTSLTIHQKFKNILDSLGTNPNQICKILNQDRPDKYYQIINGKSKPSFDTIADLISLYPQINANYFFKDDAVMFVKKDELSKKQSIIPHHVSLQIKQLEEKIHLLESQNKEMLLQLKHCQDSQNEK